MMFSSLLSSCGGGGSGNSASTTPGNTANTTDLVKPNVSGIDTDQLVYRKNTSFTITGNNLDKGINFNVPGCINIAELAGGSSTQRKFSCKVIAVGNFDVTLTDKNNSELSKKTFNVPLAIPPHVTMSTSFGQVIFKLDPGKAPISVDNFLQYVDSGFYKNKIFYRVIPGFIVQAGGVTADLKQAETFAPIKLEANNGLSNVSGSLAMARTALPDSATSEFYVNLANNASQLDTSSTNPGYAVFGKVVKGMDVITSISRVRLTKNGSFENLPVTPIIIYSAYQSQMAIDDISVDKIQYRKNSTFTIKGDKLESYIEVRIPSCFRLTELPGGDSKQRSYTCKIISPGNFSVSVSDPTNPSNSYSKTFTVPLLSQPQVTLQTTMGEIIVELNPDKAPLSVDNFLTYVESGFYTNKIFHRIVKNFVVQGGGYNSDLQSTSSFNPVKLEANTGLSNQRGTIALARTIAADSATTEFYINLVDNSKLLDAAYNPPGYAVFGKVIKGMDVIDTMALQAVQSLSVFDNLPVRPIIITSAIQTQ